MDQVSLAVRPSRTAITATFTLADDFTSAFVDLRKAGVVTAWNRTIITKSLASALAMTRFRFVYLLNKTVVANANRLTQKRIAIGYRVTPVRLA